MPDIQDSLVRVFPRGCKIEQIAIQKEPAFPEDKRFTVSKDLWDLLDEDNKAGLVLHEIIYREALLYGHEDSVNARYVNSIWTSAGNPPYFASQAALNDFFQMVKFAAGEFSGSAPLIFECSYDARGHVAVDINAPKQVSYLWPSFLPTPIKVFPTKIGQVSVQDRGPFSLGKCSDDNEVWIDMSINQRDPNRINKLIFDEMELVTQCDGCSVSN